MRTKNNHFPDQSPHFFIVAGEASGDIHAARLMRALKELLPRSRFSGIGGVNMAMEGLESIVPLADISVVGFWEVAKRYPMFKQLLQKTASMLTSGAYDVFIPVDYPGFNMRLAAAAKSAEVPVAWYIAPQLWAWGRERAAKLKALVDKLLVVLPFEPQFFWQFGIDAEFVGHPLLEDPVIAAPPRRLHDREQEIALFPGSRRQEIARNLPIMLASIDALRQSFSVIEDYCITLAVSPHLPASAYSSLVVKAHHTYDFTLHTESNSRNLLSRARAGMVKTGTSTLEAALCGLPHVMMYRTSHLSYLWAKRLITLQRIALPNILMDAAHGRSDVVAECIQHDATPQALAHEMTKLLTGDSTQSQMEADFAEIRALLGAGVLGTASSNAARIIAEMMR